MDHEKKLAFIHKMTKMGLDSIPHYDSGGGVISAGNSNPLSGISGALTAQNSFQAQAPTSSATVGAQQAGLASELQNESAGNGPNPAQQQLMQNEQQMAQQQAAVNAQNRALNPGLAARMSGNQAVQAGQTAASNAGIQQAQQQLAAQGQLQGLTGQEQSGALGAAGINAQVSQNNANSVNQEQQGLLGSIPLVGSMFSHAKGGKITNPIKMAGGGSIQVPGLPSFSNANYVGADTSKPTSGVGQILGAGSATSANNFGAGNFFSGAAPDLSDVASAAPAAAALAKGGKVPALLSPGEKYLNPKEAKAVAEGKANPMKVGKTVPGKPKVMRDSYANDTVPAMLDDGGEVLPLHIMIKRNPEKAAAFVRKHMGKKGLQK